MPAVRKNKERLNSNTTYTLVVKVNQDLDDKWTGNKSMVDQMENIIDVRLVNIVNNLRACTESIFFDCIEHWN